MRHSFGRPGLIAALIGCALLVGGGVAYATIPSSDGTITGCYNKRSGIVRLIDTEAGQACTSAEGEVSWKETARLVCPAGTTLSTGVCIETETRGAALHRAAAQDCAEDERRLPSPGELYPLAQEIGDRPEWTDDALGDPLEAVYYIIVSDVGEGVGGSQANAFYRCVAGAGIG